MGDYSPTPDPYGLVAPDGADLVINGDNRFRALVDRLSARLPLYAPLTVVDELPATPVDGEVVYFQDATMATAGVVWAFRYNASSASSYKWEFIGGAKLANDVDASGADPDGSPSLTVPDLPGQYDIEIGARVQLTNSGGTPPTAAMYVEVDSVFSDDLQIVFANTAGTTSTVIEGHRRTRKVLAAGDALIANYATSGGTGTASFSMRRLAIVPVRVG